MIEMSNLLSPYTLNDFKESIENLNRQVQNGCGNHGCIIKKPSGMATNGGCTCSPRQISRYLRFIADAVDRADPLWRDTKDCKTGLCEAEESQSEKLFVTQNQNLIKLKFNPTSWKLKFNPTSWIKNADDLISLCKSYEEQDWITDELKYKWADLREKCKKWKDELGCKLEKLDTKNESVKR